MGNSDSDCDKCMVATSFPIAVNVHRDDDDNYELLLYEENEREKPFSTNNGVGDEKDKDINCINVEPIEPPLEFQVD